MGDRQIWYHIREGFRSIFTHGLMSIAAVCMTVACLLIMGSFSLIAINANHVLGDLEDDNQFLAYIDDSLTRAQAQALEAVAAYTQTFNKMGFIETEERDEIYMALRGILDALPGDALQKDALLEQFEQLRDF